MVVLYAIYIVMNIICLRDDLLSTNHVSFLKTDGQYFFFIFFILTQVQKCPSMLTAFHFRSMRENPAHRYTVLPISGKESAQVISTTGKGFARHVITFTCTY